VLGEARTTAAAFCLPGVNATRRGTINSESCIAKIRAGSLEWESFRFQSEPSRPSTRDKPLQWWSWGIAMYGTPPRSMEAQPAASQLASLSRQILEEALQDVISPAAAADQGGLNPDHLRTLQQTARVRHGGACRPPPAQLPPPVRPPIQQMHPLLAGSCRFAAAAACGWQPWGSGALK
jgi:hypothetical protein